MSRLHSASSMIARVLLATAILLAASCDDGTKPPVPDQVVVSPATVTFTAVGETQQLTARVLTKNGKEIEGAQVSWSSSAPGVAAVSLTGLATAVSAGTATITASTEGKNGSALVTVPSYTLTVAKAGAGSGTVTSNPAGIGCGTTCTASFAAGTGVTLTAEPASGSLFEGWSGACTGTGLTCQVTMSQARSVTATFTTSGVTLGIGFGPEQFALIPAGTFQMGSTNGDSDERPVHTVNITKAFYIQKTEVTQGQWKAVMGSNPSYFGSCGDTCPVEMVRWDDIQAFLAALNIMDPGKHYRLPTEAEWEYAARGTTTGDYGGTGLPDDMGWYENNSSNRTHPVAQKQPNAWGLFDMHGNVWEWVNDWFSGTYYQYCVDNGIVDDPPGPASGSARGLRGGSWGGLASWARSAYRGYLSPSSGNLYLGFRLARTQ